MMLTAKIHLKERNEQKTPVIYSKSLLERGEGGGARDREKRVLPKFKSEMGTHGIK